MTDLLAGLHHPRARGYEKSYPQGYSPHQAYNEALDDATAALRNPTDEQVEAIDQVWRDYHYPIYDTITGHIKCACGEPKRDDLHRIRVYLAAAAGGDDD